MARPLPSLIPRWIEAQPKLTNDQLPDFTVYEDRGKVVVAGGRVTLGENGLANQVRFFQVPTTNTGWPIRIDGSVYLYFDGSAYPLIACTVQADSGLPANTATEFHILLASITAGRIEPASGGLGPVWANYAF